MTSTQRVVENMPIDQLVPYERNARTHSEKQIGMIADSIKAHGFNNPVLIDEANMIIAGHGRFQAAKLLRLSEVPCLRLTHLTPAQKRAYILADNRLAEKSGWDRDILQMELGDLALEGFDIELTGFSAKDLESKLATDAQLGDGLAYKIIVDCENEEAQAKLMETLEAQGFSVHPLIA